MSGGPAPAAPSSGVAGRLRHGALRVTGALAAARVASVVVALLAWLSWPVASVVAAPRLDPSWAVGLSLAVSRSLAFGREVVFTYGPLGFITAPRALSGGILLAGVAGAAVLELLLAALLLRALRARLALVPAALVALGALLIVAATGASFLDDIGFGACALALGAPPERAGRAARRLALGGGALAGLALLVKFSDGVAVSAMVAVGVLGLPRARRTLPLAVLALAIAVVAAWLALGQPLAALPDYVRTGAAISRGYADAMGYDLMGANGHWELLVVVASAAILAAGAWMALSGLPRRRRVALAVAVLIVHYFVAREMFVRYDAEHAATIGLLVAVPLLIPWPRHFLGVAGAGAASLAVAALAVLGLAAITPGSVFDPVGRASAFVSQVGTVISPAGAIAEGRQSIQAYDALPSALVDALSGHCVNVDPIEVSVVWAYPQWRWCPVGVLQSYAAYTRSLDDLDARAYANARTGPDRVLRETGATIDGRNAAWEPPAAMLSLLCHFAEIGRGGRWQALARVPDRCGRPRVLGTLASAGAAAVTIPAAPSGMVLLARVHGLGIHLGERVETLFGRAHARALSLDAGVALRVVPDTLRDGLILGVPPAVDYAAPFNLGQPAHTIVAEIGGTPVPFSVTLVGVPIAAR